MSPAMIFNSEDFPAPLLPTSPRISPLDTFKLARLMMGLL
jgi:hypothetical protein